MKPIKFFILTIALFASAAAFSCDEESVDEKWTCTTEVTGKDNELFGPCWGEENKWACYENVKETCVEQTSGRETSFEKKNFLGCYESMSDCW